MQINPKTNKPFGYHVKGKQTLTEFCCFDALQEALTNKNLENNYLLWLCESKDVTKPGIQHMIISTERIIGELNEKIAFYKWMLN